MKKNLISYSINLYKKRFILKNKIKKRFSFLKMKYKIITFLKFYKNFHFFKNLTNKILFVNILKKPSNVFINYSNMDGTIISKFSSGFYSKRSLKKSFFAINLLFQKSFVNLKYKNLKLFYYLFINGSLNENGFKKNIKYFLELKKFNTKFNSICNISKIAHNGVRKKKQKRK